MADLQTTIELIFQGVDNASEVSDSVGNSLKGLNESVSSITEPLADFAKDIAVVQGALVALAVVIGTLAYKESIEFETSLLGLQKAMNDGEGDARDLAKELETLALRYGTNANELVQSAADFKMGGYDVKTSIDLVKQSLDLMIAGDISAADATDIMKRSLAGFGVANADAAKEAARLGEAINRIADVANSDFDQLAAAFADLAPTAKLTGLSFEEVAAILSVVIDRTGSGSEAATSLNSAFLSLVAPANNAATEMEKMGIQFDVAGKPIGSVKQILETLVPAFAKMTDEQKLFSAAQIAGKEQARAFVAVLGDWETAQERVKIALKDSGSTIEKEVTIRLGSANAAINSTNEAFRQLLVALGDEIQVNTTGVIRSLGELAISFRDVIDAGKLDPLFNLLRPQLAAIETLFKDVAKNLPAAFEGLKFDGLVNALKALGEQAQTALEALLGPIDLKSVDGLKEALQRVVDLVTELIRITTGELGGLTPFLAGVREMALTFKDASQEAQGLVGNLLGLSVGFQGVSGMIGDAALVFLAFGDKLKALPGLLTAFGAELRLIGTLAASGNIAAGLGAAGIAGAVGLLVFELMRLSGLDRVLADMIDPDASDTIFRFLEHIGLLPPAIAKIGDGADKPIIPLSKLAQAEEEQIQKSKEYRAELDVWFAAQKAAAEAPADTTKEIERLTEAMRKQDLQYDASTGTVKAMASEEFQRNMQLSDMREKFLDASRAQTGYVGSVENGVVTYRQYGTALAGAKKATDEITDAQKKTQKEILESTKVANDFQVKMEQIASNERIKNIEAAVSIKTAQLEADADRVRSVFESIDTTINSTGDLLGGLFGNLIDAKSSWDKLTITDQIDKENQRRQDALDLQKKMAEKEMERIDAQIRSLNRGDSLITIEGSGLKPELEAFMWKILSLIRVRANAEFSEYLLGLGVT